MARLAVDCDIISFIESSGRTQAMTKLRGLKLLITQTVWDECSEGAAGGRRIALLHALGAAATPLLAGEPEAVTAAAFLQQGDLEEGELSILAFAVHHADVVPVFHERHALFRAVEELRGRRVLSFHGFLGELREAHGLAHGEADRISSWYCASGGKTWRKSVRPVRPAWW
jgi:hypothetical protein